MELFVGNITADIREVELRKFFGRFAKDATFSLRKLKFDHASYFYAQVEIEPEKLALKAIKKLHGKRLNGKPVSIREYEYRVGNNDRRALNWRELLWNGIERRFSERRQSAKLFVRHEPEFTGYNNLAKKG